MAGGLVDFEGFEGDRLADAARERFGGAGGEHGAVGHPDGERDDHRVGFNGVESACESDEH